MSTVKFSDGNTKMEKIPSVSLPAIRTGSIQTVVWTNELAWISYKTAKLSQGKTSKG